MWLFLCSDAVPQYFPFQTLQKAGLELLQPDVDVQEVVREIPRLPGIAEAYHLDKKEVGLIFLG